MGTRLASRAVLLSLSLAPLAAGATVIVQPSLERMSARAEVIAHAVVEAQHVTLGEDGARIVTLSRVRVLAPVKGTKAGERLVIYQVGGHHGDRVLVVHGASRFQVGEEVVLFGERFLAANTVRFLQKARGADVPRETLHPSGGFVVPYGIGLGKFVVDRRGAVPMAIEDLGDVAVAVRGKQGTVIRAAAARTEQPLDVFLSEVRRLASGGKPR
jgi:aspartate 1-decarboxylase